MNKLMITIGLLSSMTITKPNEMKRDGTKVHNNIQIAWSIDSIEDLQQYIGDDMYNGEIDQEIGENYYEILEETRRWLLNWYQDNQRNTK